MTPTVSLLTSCYHGQKYLASFFQNVQEQTIFDQIEIVLILNEPGAEELEIVQAFQSQHPEQIQFHIVNPVELLGCSWNRTWKQARGEYVGMWNIDDRRAADSLEKQANILNEQPDIALVYGDYLIVPLYGSQCGTRRKTHEFNRKLFRREFPSGGAFSLWRKSIAESVGYFDEQLKCGPDFDLSVRMAIYGFSMKRVEGIIGFFTDEQQGISTSDAGQLAATERTVIQYRYGIYDLIRPEWKQAANQYRMDAINNFGVWISVSQLIPDYPRLIQSKKYLWIPGWFRNAFRTMMRKTRIINIVYRFLRKKEFEPYE